MELKNLNVAEITNNKAMDTVCINGCLILDKVRECTTLMSYEPTLSQPSLSMHQPIRFDF